MLNLRKSSFLESIVFFTCGLRQTVAPHSLNSRYFFSTVSKMSERDGLIEDYRKKIKEHTTAQET
jgi:hypothetical protein